MQRIIFYYKKNLKLLISMINSVKVDILNIFKKSYKKKNLLEISNFNKSLITIIFSIFLYLFYITIPSLYDKTWVQNDIEKKLVKEFKLNFNLSSEITYALLPSPHYNIKNATILDYDKKNPKKISEIKSLKVFISQKNFFKKNLVIRYVTIDEANFLFKVNNFKFIKKFINQKFSHKRIEIKKSNIFLENIDQDILLINKISELDILFNDVDNLNEINLSGEVFNIPFLLNLNNDLTNSTLSYKITSDKLKLVFQDSFKKYNDYLEGSSKLNILNSKIIQKYKIKENIITFKSNNSRLINNKIKFDGKIDIKPFNFFLDTKIEKITLNKFFNNQSILVELIKQDFFFNNNLNAKMKLEASIVKDHNYFKDLQIFLTIGQGDISLDNSSMKIKKIGLLKLNNSQIFILDNVLLLSGEFLVEVDNNVNFYKFFQTPKNYKKEIENIKINFDYNILLDELTINNFLINDFKTGDALQDVINSFNSRKNNFSNIVEFKNFFNKLMLNYDG